MDYMTIDEIKQTINNKELKEGTILFSRSYDENIGFYITYKDGFFYNKTNTIIQLEDFKEDEIFRVKSI